jgi:hypothetical protein
MSRVSGPEQIVVRPANNVYTALVIVCVVIEFVGLIALFLTHKTLFGTGLFG